ncbi:MAG TPA: hypothetical protein VJ984_16175 [Xanthomonadales bacterium]|nr:hypothetical protein [Xanthomonadales bacterium]
MTTIMKICIAGMLLFVAIESVYAGNIDRKTPIPYQVDFVLQWNDGNSSTNLQTVGDEGVPQGMHLVLKNANYLIAAGVDATGHCVLGRSGGGPELAFLPAPVHWVESPANGMLIGFGNVSPGIIVDEGDYIVTCNRSTENGSGSARVKVTGVLMPN